MNKTTKQDANKSVGEDAGQDAEQDSNQDLVEDENQDLPDPEGFDRQDFIKRLTDAGLDKKIAEAVAEGQAEFIRAYRAIDEQFAPKSTD